MNEIAPPRQLHRSRYALIAHGGTLTMNDIVINEELFAAFSKHLSAGLNVVDVLHKLRQLNAHVDLKQDDPIMLAVSQREMIPRLIDLKYPEFILACIKNFRLLDNCRDVFHSQIERELVDLFAATLERFTQKAWIENMDEGFVIHSTALVADLIVPPIGGVHKALLQSLSDLTQVRDAVGGRSELYLHAKSATPESQYIHIWVAAKLGISLAPATGTVGVL